MTSPNKNLNFLGNSHFPKRNLSGFYKYRNLPHISSEDIKKQAGITLLLAILILSAILAIAFTIATILFTEIRASGDMVRTEGAIFAADAVSEEALFKIKRKVPNSIFSYTSGFGKINLNSPPPQESSSTPLVYQDQVLEISNSFPNTTNRYPLFDGNNPNSGSGYGRIKITFLTLPTSDYLKVYICEYDPNGSYATPVCTDVTSSEYWSPNGNDGKNIPILPTGSSITMDLDPTKQQEIILYNLGGNDNLWVQLEGFASNRTTPKGLPLVGETAVDIHARSSGVTRSIRVTVPNGK